MILQGQVGSQTLSDSSTPQTVRMGRKGDLTVSELHGRYAEATARGNKFYGSNGATPSITTVGLATTYTGLVLFNPAGSGVTLELDKVGYSFLVAFSAAATIGLMVGYTAAGIVTSSAAASPGAGSFIGGTNATPQGRVALSATLVGTPTLHTVFGSGLTGAITTIPDIQQIVDMEGSLILAPGAYAAIYTSTASGAASLAASFQWSEYAL